jgi:hypothetical protein
MTYQGLGMRMSFEDIMCKLFFLFFHMAPFSFQKGRKVFNGAIGCNFHFLCSLVQYKGQIPPHVKYKIWDYTIECKSREEAQKSSLGMHS